MVALTSSIFIGVAAAASVLLILLTAFLLCSARSAKNGINKGEEDFDILASKVVRASRSPAQKGWAKAGAIAADALIATLFLCFGVLLFTKLMPGIGIPYSLEAVKTPSMASVLPSNESHVGDGDRMINVNDIVVIKKVESLDEISLYDVVSYRHPSGVNVIHRVVEKTDSYLLTQGDANAEDDGVKVTLAMLNGRYTGVSIPYLGAVTFYLQDDYGILGMSALAYCVIAAEVYSSSLSSVKQKRVAEYDKLFGETGAKTVTYSDENGTISFGQDYKGSIDKERKTPTRETTFQR